MNQFYFAVMEGAGTFTRAVGIVFVLLAVLAGFVPVPAWAASAFTPPAVVNSDVITTSVYYGSTPALASDGADTCVAVWTGLGSRPVSSQGQDPSTSNAGNEDIFFSRSLDHGLTWSPRAQLKTSWATDDGDDLEPAIATDGQGRWIAVWRSRDPLGGALGYDADILAATSTDNGLTWSAPVPVNNDAAADPGKDDVAPCIATNAQGRWIVSWTVMYLNTKGFKVEGIWAATSIDLGATWGAPAKLIGRSVNAPPFGMISSLATDRKLNWVIVTNLIVSGGADEDIFRVTSADDGRTWNVNNQPLNSNGWWNVEDKVPSLDTDRKGTWITAWPSKVDMLSTSTVVGPTFNIWFSRSVDNGLTWSPIAQLNSVPETGGVDNANVQLSNDGNGNWVAIWSTRKWGGDRDLAYAVSRDGGLTWSAAAPLNTNALSDELSDCGNCQALALATDRLGHWLALWDTENNPLGPPRGLRLVVAAALRAPGIDCAPGQLRYREGTRLAVDVTKGGKPTTASLTLQSTGITPLTVSALQLSGAYAADFSLVGAPALPLTIPPGGSQPLVVRFAPTETVRTLGMAASLNIISDDTSNTTFQVPLMGDAVPVSLSRFEAE